LFSLPIPPIGAERPDRREVNTTEGARPAPCGTAKPKKSNNAGPQGGGRAARGNAYDEG
jgi:hypothetical protein